jgi:uncharacterized damage-inducible protein DinB
LLNALRHKFTQLSKKIERSVNDNGCVLERLGLVYFNQTVYFCYMTIAQHLAQHIRQAFTGGSWTTVSVQKMLEPISLEQAQQVHIGNNSILKIVQHFNYYFPIQLSVLQGGPLIGKDAESWQQAALLDETAWQQYKQEMLDVAEQFAQQVESLSDEQLLQPFDDEKYGSVYRNIAGVVEHLYYHLGQISALVQVQSNQTL